MEINQIKALTLWQPWASLTALGFKKIETRSWYSPYRGMVAIHAAALMKQECISIYLKEPFYTPLKNMGYGQQKYLPAGEVLALATIKSWKQVVAPETIDFQKQVYTRAPSGVEREYGDYTPGRYAIELVDLMILPMPIQARGNQLLWNWTCPMELFKEYSNYFGLAK